MSAMRLFGFWKTAAAAPSGTAFVTGETISALASAGGNYALGMDLVIGASSITVTHIGRYKNAGNSGSHAAGFFNPKTSPALAGSTVTIDMSQTPDADGFVYVALASPFTLIATSNYSLAGVEVSGGDQYGAGNDTSITHTSVATVQSAVYIQGGMSGGGTIGSAGGADHCYGPYNFKYSSP